MQILLQTRRLQVARGLPLAALLVKERESFRLKVTTARSEATELWPEGQHDDLVLAAAQAGCWGEKTLPALEGPPQSSRGPGLRAV